MDTKQVMDNPLRNPEAKRTWEEIQAPYRKSFELIDENVGSFLYEDGFDLYIKTVQTEFISHVWRKLLTGFRDNNVQLERLLWALAVSVNEMYPEAQCIKFLEQAADAERSACEQKKQGN